MAGTSGRLVVLGRAGRDLANRLQHAGFRVGVAADRAQAREQIESAPTDVLVLAVGAPEEDAAAEVRALRARFAPGDLAILVVSPQAGDEAVLGALRAGADDYLVTPFEFPVLLARLKVLARWHQPEGPDRDIPPARPFRGLPGETLGPYRIQEVLGQGGMGSVYRALDTRLGRVVALKVLPADLVPDPEHFGRFLQEGRIMARLAHPQVVPVWDVGTGPIPYLAMELVPGQDLEHVLGLGVLTPRRAAAMALDIARVLQAVHAAGVVHRDLKPGNLVVEPSGRVRLLDFGISRLLDAEVRLTMPGCTMGTPAYMAPEQVDPRSPGVDARADLYALGLILYEMLVGTVPFRREGLTGMLQEILGGNPMSPRKARSDVPEELDRICRVATERDPDRRFPSAEAMARALESFLESTDPDGPGRPGS